MKRIIVLTLLVGIFVPLVRAEFLSKESALLRALESNATGKMLNARSSSIDSYEYSFSVKAESSDECLYVYNRRNGEGYMVVSADDLVRPVLGRSDSGNADAENIPSAFKWWLENYAYEIEALRLGKTVPAKSSYSDHTLSDRVSVAPMLTTKWGQTSPFHDKMPTVELNGVQYHYFTGCVATAIAQVMNYYKWPSKGTGRLSYIDNLGVERVYECEKESFDWDNMLDIYEQGKYGVENSEAVSNLMWACAVAAESSFYLDMTGGNPYPVLSTLTRNFGYDNSWKLESRSQYGLGEWNELIYKELNSGRPVVYVGESVSGSHQFVCDGYDVTNDMFHINWGWEGSKDGYFSLSALNPSLMLAPEYFDEDDDFRYGQKICVNLQPYKGTPRQLSVSANNNVVYKGNDNFGIYDQPMGGGGLYISDIYKEEISTLQVGFRVVDQDGDAVSIFGPSYETQYNAGTLCLYADWSIDLKSLNLPAGEYRLYPIYRCAEVDCQGDISFDSQSVGYLVAIVDESGVISYEPGERRLKTDLRITDFKVGEVYKNQEFEYSVNYTISDDMLLNIQDGGYISIYDADKSVVAVLYLGFYPSSMEYSNISSLNLNPGLYEVRIFDKYGFSICDRHLTIEVKGRDGTTPFEIMPPDGIVYATKEYTLRTTLPDEANDKVEWSLRNTSGQIRDGGVFIPGWLAPSVRGNATVVATYLDWAATIQFEVMPFFAVTHVWTPEISSNMKVGEAKIMQVIIAPDIATNKKLYYTSSDSSVASVDENGMITAMSLGYAVITATSADNPELSTATYITVDGYSSIENIEEEGVKIVVEKGDIVISGLKNSCATLYDMQGTLVYQGYENRISGLSQGLYILVIDGKRYKVLLKP